MALCLFFEREMPIQIPSPGLFGPPDILGDIPLDNFMHIIKVIAVAHVRDVTWPTVVDGCRPYVKTGQHRRSAWIMWNDVVLRTLAGLNILSCHEVTKKGWPALQISHATNELLPLMVGADCPRGALLWCWMGRFTLQSLRGRGWGENREWITRVVPHRSLLSCWTRSQKVSLNAQSDSMAFWFVIYLLSHKFMSDSYLGSSLISILSFTRFLC